MRLLCDRYPTALEFISGREDIDGMRQAVSRPTTAIRKVRTDNNIATDAVVASGIARLATGRNTNVKLVEPPSCSSPSAIVFIGKNSRGNWVAQEQNGLYGGLFVNRAQAIKYALFENGRHPETIVELSREIELDMGGNLPASDPTLAPSSRRAV
jgi:hypothetical protein